MRFWHGCSRQLEGLNAGVDNIDDLIDLLATEEMEREKEKLTGWLQAGTSNKEAVNVVLLGQFAAVLLADTASVDNASVVGNGGGDLLEPLADGSVHFLGLSGGGDLASADGPVDICLETGE